MLWYRLRGRARGAGRGAPLQARGRGAHPGLRDLALRALAI